MLAMHDEVHAMEDKQSAGRSRKADMDRWYEDGTMDRKYAEHSIKAGVLQIVASQFVGQSLQQRAGETGMTAGTKRAIAASQKSNKYWEATHRRPRRIAKSASLLRDGSVRGWVKMTQNYRGSRKASPFQRIHRASHAALMRQARLEADRVETPLLPVGRPWPASRRCAAAG
jgi:hypothetical protein